MPYFINIYTTYRDLENQEAGFRARTTNGTYTVLLDSQRVIVHPRGEDSTTYHIEEDITRLPHLTAMATLAVMQYEAELYGEPS